jgi:hypothetical protein
MDKEILNAMRNGLIAVTLICLGAMLLLPAGCSVVYDSPSDNIEGDNNNKGEENNQEQNEDNSVAGAAAASVSPFLLLVVASVALGGCLGPVTFAPNVTLGVNSGNQGSGTGIGTDEETGLQFEPKVEREGGATVETNAELPVGP